MTVRIGLLGSGFVSNFYMLGLETVAGWEVPVVASPNADHAAAFAQKWDLVGLFDVVEHIEDDKSFLLRLREILNDRGWLAITVPAFPFLWSTHDVNLHHYRRYTKTTLKKVLEETQYDIEYASYWNMSLFLPAAAMRLMGRSGASGLSLPGTLDTLFFGLIKAETQFQSIVPLPFGTGIVVIARKRATAVS